ncbi:MAG TPA: FAD-binding oxidoreductase [Acidisphaera sp.]|nr:FAD-binding oxidoreductase [Acidisphaera sp.]
MGGGIVGSCTALFLARADAPDVRVIERDPTYAQASTTLSAAGLRTQFSLPLNVAMSRFGADFLRPVRDTIGWRGNGYLLLATDAARLRANHDTQRTAGAQLAWLDPPALAARFPWLRTDDLAAGSLGLADEGWFDAHALLRHVRSEAVAAGARYTTGEVDGIDTTGGRVAAVLLSDGTRIDAAHAVLAAGAWSGRLAARIGFALPVVPRKRTVFVLRAPLSVSDMPLILDASGLWLRPEGEGFLAGISPPEAQDRDADGDFEPDLDMLEDEVWPRLAHRIPAFEQLRRVRAWAGHYDTCTLDHNAVIGAAPGIAGLFIATGFSGHGVQHAPATGRAIAELVVHGEYRTLDLTPFGYDRVAADRPLSEDEIY